MTHDYIDEDDFPQICEEEPCEECGRCIKHGECTCEDWPEYDDAFKGGK